MINKSDSISDELLAAFLDGNVTRKETEQVLEVISKDNGLMEVVEITEDVISFEEKLGVWKEDYGFWEMGIDPVLNPEDFSNGAEAFSTTENEELFPSEAAAFTDLDSDNDLEFPSDDVFNSNDGLDSSDKNDIFNTNDI